MAFLAVAIAIVVWDIVVAGQAARAQLGPEWFRWITGLAGLLLVPALVVAIADGSLLTARITSGIAWLWPLTLVLFALQALYAAIRRLVNPFLGFFMSAYDLLIAVDVVLRYMGSEGRPLPGIALAFLAATSGAFAWTTQNPSIIASPAFLFVPMAAPAFPALRAWSASFRVFLAPEDQNL